MSVLCAALPALPHCPSIFWGTRRRRGAAPVAARCRPAPAVGPRRAAAGPRRPVRACVGALCRPAAPPAPLRPDPTGGTHLRSANSRRPLPGVRRHGKGHVWGVQVSWDGSYPESSFHCGCSDTHGVLQLVRRGKGRLNYRSAAMLPKGAHYEWCPHCRASGRWVCSACMGTGRRRDPIGFRIE